MEEHARSCTVCGKVRSQYYVLYGKSHDNVLGYIEPHYWNWGVFCCTECREKWVEWQIALGHQIRFYELLAPKERQSFKWILWEIDMGKGSV